MKRAGMQNPSASMAEPPVESRVESPEIFNDRFVRCLHLLFFIAGRVLGGPEDAGEAVQNCYATASRNPPCFEYESAFRGWLLRILIDEAVFLLRERDAPRNYQEPGLTETRLVS